MTRVDFYLLRTGLAESAELITCRLADKAYTLGHRVFIHTDNDDQAARLDDLLWTYAPGSFVPHCRLTSEQAAEAPILLGNAAPPEAHTDVLINLATQVPAFFSRFERVAEIVAAEAQTKAEARERYRFYRDRGYPLETHELDT